MREAPLSVVVFVKLEELSRLCCARWATLMQCELAEGRIMDLIKRGDVFLSYDSDGTLNFPPLTFYGATNDYVLYLDNMIDKRMGLLDHWVEEVISGDWDILEGRCRQEGLDSGILRDCMEDGTIYAPSFATFWHIVAELVVEKMEKARKQETVIKEHVEGEGSFLSYAKFRAHYVGNQKHYFHIVTNSP
jgi:hypothetical protein